MDLPIPVWVSAKWAWNVNRKQRVNNGKVMAYSTEIESFSDR
jgi:hypothetical protein